MTLAWGMELVAESDRRGLCVGAFNVIHLETAEALVAAAERVGRPIILQLSENCVDFHGALEPIGLGMLALARASHAPVAVHLDHAKRTGLIFDAIELGFTSVMYDGADLSFDENIATTQAVVARARSASVGVEAELGAIGGKGGAHTPGVRTDPAEAEVFVRSTGVDALAVAVGSEHAMTSRTATIDIELVRRLRAAAGIPLVLHGASGVSDLDLLDAARAGLSKINISTHLAGEFTRSVRAFLADHPNAVDSRLYVGDGRRAVELEAARLLSLFGGLELSSIRN